MSIFAAGDRLRDRSGLPITVIGTLADREGARNLVVYRYEPRVTRYHDAYLVSAADEQEVVLWVPERQRDAMLRRRPSAWSRFVAWLQEFGFHRVTPRGWLIAVGACAAWIAAEVLTGLVR